MTIGFPPSASDEVRWQSESVAPAHNGALSFAGEGHAIWQTGKNGEPATSASPDARAGWRAFANSAPNVTIPPHAGPPRIFRGRIPPPGYGYYYAPGFFYDPFFFGFGPDCNPYFWNTWDITCPGLGFYSGWDGYGYGYSGYYGGDAYLGAGGGTDTSSYTPDVSAPPVSSQAAGEAAAPSVVMLYLNDGTSFAVTDYWVADYQLHYVTEDAREGTLDLNQIDVQRTVDQNASRGVTFSLKPAPNAPPGAPSNGQPPATPSQPEQQAPPQ